ncbi:hypothetical protein VTI28DRAFT_6930 [Corynascus sepedonium]
MQCDPFASRFAIFYFEKPRSAYSHFTLLFPVQPLCFGYRRLGLSLVFFFSCFLSLFASLANYPSQKLAAPIATIFEAPRYRNLSTPQLRRRRRPQSYYLDLRTLSPINTGLFRHMIALYISRPQNAAVATGIGARRLTHK